MSEDQNIDNSAPNQGAQGVFHGPVTINQGNASQHQAEQEQTERYLRERLREHQARLDALLDLAEAIGKERLPYHLKLDIMLLHDQIMDIKIRLRLLT